MAVIQYTALVNQMRGKLNGTTLNKSRTVNTAQRKQQQPAGSRGFQDEIRNVFSQVQRWWKELTVFQQQQWQLAANNNPTRDRFGNQVILSGYNQFIKAGIVHFYADGSFASTPATSTSPANTPVLWAASDPEFDEAPGQGVVISFNQQVVLPIMTDTWVAIIEVSLPMSRGVTNYSRRYSFVTSQLMDTAFNRFVQVSLGDKYPMPQPGQRVIVRLRIFNVACGAEVYTESRNFNT